MKVSMLFNALFFTLANPLGRAINLMDGWWSLKLELGTSWDLVFLMTLFCNKVP